MNNKNKKFISVYVTSSRAKLCFIKSLLNSNKISYYIDNENASIIGDSIPYVNVMVYEEDAPFVKDLLKDIK